MKRLSTFGKIFFAYLLIIVIALVGIFFYVRGVMVEYENASADRWILVQTGDAAKKKGDIYNFLKDRSFGGQAADLGDAKARQQRFEKLASGEIEVKLNPYSYDSARPIYDVFADGKPFLTVCVEEGKTRTKLGILTMSDWNLLYSVQRSENTDIKSFKASEDGTYSCTVSIPQGFTLFIDGKAYDGEKKETDISDFQYMAPYVAVPKYYTYEFSNIGFEPEFSVTNNGGQEVELTKDKKNNYSAKAEFVASDEAKKVITANMDPLAMAQLWSKFMTDDVHGTYHGFDTVVEECKLLKGTSLYSQGRSWSRGVDVQFVSVHTLKGFSGDRVENYIKYNDNLYSCDVYTEKNMRLKTGADRTDIFDNRMFFANISGRWYLIDMFSLAK